jgi:hypothetical protein
MPFQRFRFWRADSITIHLQLTANRFLSGRLLVFFVPTMIQNGWPISPSNGVLLQHVWLDPSASSSVDLVIPFNYNKGWLNLTRTDTLGQLRVVVFNPLLAATGTTPTVDLKVFVTFQKSEFKVPIPGGSSYAALTAHSAVRQSGVAGMVGAIAADKFSDLIKSVLPSNIVGDMIGGLLDRPEDPTDPQPIANKDQGYLSNSRGVANLEKLTLEPSAQQLVDEEHFSTVEDEMSIDYLCKKKYSYIGTRQWSTTQVVGTVLYSDIVGPLTNLLQDFAEGALISPVATRMIDYVARLFHFWRGSLKYMIDIAGTQFHEGRLDLVFLPAVDTPITSVGQYNQMQSIYLGSVVVRNGQNSMAFECPFLSDTPWKQVYYGGVLSNTGPGNFRFDDFATGIFQVVVSSQLRAPTNVASTVEMNVFQSAGDDFEVCTTSYYNGSLTGTPYNPSFVVSAVRESGVGNLAPNLNNSANNVSAINLATSRARTSDGQVKHFGDSYKSLRELAKRYTFLESFPVDFSIISNDDKTAIQNGFNPLIMVLPVAVSDMTLYPKSLFDMYRTIRGPLRFKIKLRTNAAPDIYTTGQDTNNFGYVNFIPQLNQALYPATNPQALSIYFGQGVYGGDGLTAMPAVRFSNTQVAEFEMEFPYHYSVAKIPWAYETIATQDIPSYFFFDLVCALYITDVNVVTPFRYFVDVWMAFGDTTHCGTFVGLPQLTLQPGGSGYSPFPDLWIPHPSSLAGRSLNKKKDDKKKHLQIKQ